MGMSPPVQCVQVGGLPKWQSPHVHARPHGVCTHLHLMYARAEERGRQVRHVFPVELFQEFFGGLRFRADLPVQLIQQLLFDAALRGRHVSFTWWRRQRRPAASFEHVVDLRAPIGAAPLAPLSFRPV